MACSVNRLTSSREPQLKTYHLSLTFVNKWWLIPSTTKTVSSVFHLNPSTCLLLVSLGHFSLLLSSCIHKAAQCTLCMQSQPDIMILFFLYLSMLIVHFFSKFDVVGGHGAMLPEMSRDKINRKFIQEHSALNDYFLARSNQKEKPPSSQMAA